MRVQAMCVGPNSVMTGVLKGRREMARAGIGRDQERRPAHAGLGEPDRQRLIGQADDTRVAGRPHDLARWLALIGPANDQDRHIRPDRPVAAPARRNGVRASSWPGQMLRRCSGRRSAARPPVPERQRPGRPRLRRRASWPARVRSELDLAADLPRQLQIRLDDRRRDPAPRRVARLVAAGRSASMPAAVADVTDPSRNAGHPGDPGAAKRVGQKDRESKPLAAQPANDRAWSAEHDWLDRGRNRSSRRTRGCRPASAPPSA